MGSFEIRWKNAAVKELRGLAKSTIERIHAGVSDLAKNPFPQASKKLAGSENNYRIRVGDYRVVYSVFSDILTIEIVRVGHRKQIFRRG